MRLTWRTWATAFAAAALAHVGVVAVVLWQESDAGTGATGPGAIRVSLGRTGGAMASAVTEVSRVPEAETVAAFETASDSPSAEAVPTEEPTTTIRVAETTSAREPPPLPARIVEAETTAQSTAFDDATPAEPVEQAMDIRASPPSAVAVVETTVAPPVQVTASAREPATTMPIQIVDAKTATQTSVPDNAAPVEAAVHITNIEAAESEVFTVVETAAETAVEEASTTNVPAAIPSIEIADASEAFAATETAIVLPVEEAVVPAPAEPVRQEPPPATTSETDVIAPAVAPAGSAPVETIETVVQPGEDSALPTLEATAVEVPDTWEATVAEAATSSPIEEVNSTAPQRAAPARQPDDSVDAKLIVQVETTVDPAPRNANVEPAEHAGPVRGSQAQHPAFAATVEPPEEVAKRTVIASPLPEEDDSGRAAIPALGSGTRVEAGGNRGAHQGYLRRVLERIARFKRYPREARRDGVVGKVMVRFTILADGSVQSRHLASSSGDSRLDQAALEMLSRASPFPPIPRSLAMGKLELSLPVEFSLSRRRTLF